MLIVFYMGRLYSALPELNTGGVRTVSAGSGGWGEPPVVLSIPVHFLVVLHILSARALLHPVHVILVPVNCQLNTILEHRGRCQPSSAIALEGSIAYRWSWPLRSVT